MNEYKYTPTTWIGGKTIGTADVMNNIEDGIAKAHERLDNLGDISNGEGNNNIDLSNYATKNYVNEEISKIELTPGAKGDKGEKGDVGITPSISIGTVTTLSPNQQATVTRRGTDTNPIFDFGIPKGDKGEQGSGNTESNINTSSEVLIVDYTLTTNKVLQPIALDFSTGVFTFENPHGITNGTRLLLDFKPEEGKIFNILTIPKELISFSWTTWYFIIVEVVDDYNLKLKSNVNNSYITFVESDTPSFDINSFRFEVAQEIKLNNLPLNDYYKIKIEFDFYTISQTYLDGISVLTDSTITSPLKHTYNGKMARYIRPSSLIYPNASMDLNNSNIYGHTACFRHDYVVNTLTLHDYYLERDVVSTIIGYTNTFNMHDNNALLRNYRMYNKFEGKGYENGNRFLDNLTISIEHKVLNGSKIKIYGVKR